MGVEKALKAQGIELIRTDIGDKYVNSMLVEKDLLIGGEQSGHVIVRDLLSTGDGIFKCTASFFNHNRKKCKAFTANKNKAQCSNKHKHRSKR